MTELNIKKDSYGFSFVEVDGEKIYLSAVDVFIIDEIKKIKATLKEAKK